MDGLVARLPIIGCDWGLARDVTEAVLPTSVVDGKKPRLTLTGDDRPVSSYNFILRAFDSTDVDADEVKNIYDAYPFDATKH